MRGLLSWWVRCVQLEIDEYGYAVVKSGVQEEEEEERTTGVEWRRQPWYSDEPFFDFLEVPKAAPELTLDHEKEFLLEGKLWAGAARTPWIGDEGEITDAETKKVSLSAQQKRTHPNSSLGPTCRLSWLKLLGADWQGNALRTPIVGAE